MALEQDIATIFQMLSNQEQLIRDLEIRLGDTDNNIPNEFTGLSDTPPDYATAAVGDIVTVDSSGIALEFTTPAGGANTFLNLPDTPPDYVGHANKVATVKGAEDGLEFTVPVAGVSSFTGLSDTPAIYTGEAGKVATVKGAEDGLEFLTPVTIS